MADSLHRIGTLYRMQTGDIIRTKEQLGRGKRAFLTFLRFCVVVVVTAALTFLLSFLADTFAFSLHTNLLASIFLILQLVSVVSNISTIQSVLYTNKENAMLLAFPCSYKEIAASKIAIFCRTELGRNCYFLLPFMLAFGLAGGCPLSYWLALLPVWLYLSLLPVAVSIFFANVWLYGKRVIQSNTVLYAVFLVACFVGLFFVARALVMTLPNPLRVVQQYDVYLKKLNGLFAEIAGYAWYYNHLAKLLFGQRVWLYALLPGGVLLFFVLLNHYASLPFYFSAVSSSAERSSRQKRIRAAQHKDSLLLRPQKDTHALYLTFLRKEWILTFRDLQKLASLIAALLVLPIVSFVMNYVLTTIRTSNMGDFMTVAFNVMISISLLSAFNSDSACALSMEGMEFAVLKAAPGNMMSIAWAKITLTMFANAASILLTMVMLYFSTDITALNLGLLAVVLLLLSTGLVFWSFELDVRRPRIHDYAVKGNAVIDNPNIATAIVQGFVVATLAGIVTLLLLYDDFRTGWIRILLLALAFFFARWFLLRRNLSVYFKEIEL